MGEGVVTISAYAENDETVMDSITISTFADEFYNMEFSLIQPEAESFEPGDIFQLEWTGAGAPTYFESDSYFVTIDENGLVTVDEGYTEYFYVTITAMNNLYIDEITILVHTPNAEQDTLDWPTISLYLSEEVPPMEELEVGDTFDISYELNNALVYLWSSDNEEVATVDDNGKVTIHGYGEFTIDVVVSNENGLSSDSISFNIESKVSGDSNNDGEVSIADAVAVLAYVSNAEINDFTVQAFSNADVHDTGNGVNASDALMIQQYATGVIESFPIVSE